MKKKETILDRIVAVKRTEVACLTRSVPSVEMLRAAIGKRGGVRDFLGALRAAPANSLALIAEVKKASPSAGLIRPDFDPTAIAQAYEAAGASCLSVLTDTPFFQGSLDYLRQIREKVALPLLRKDFIIDARQIMEAVEWGADAILLIVAILGDDELSRFHELATKAGLAVLVEVHDEAELERAMRIDAALVGVNNRDLRNFQVDLATTERLAAQFAQSPDRSERILVAESGIHTPADVQRLARCGAQAMLVGESLMRHDDLATKVRELLGDPSTGSANPPHPEL